MLRTSLAARDHGGFIGGLQLALEGAGHLHRDYLQALGGEGLYIALHEDAEPGVLGKYASLLVAGKIHVPASVALALNERMPSAELLAHAERLLANVDGEDSDAVPASHTQEYRANRTTAAGIQLKRKMQIIDMGFGTYSASDALGLKRSVFRSEQEKAFLQALTLRFPALMAFPNYPLDQIADFDRLSAILDDKTIRYGRHCRIDALLVVPGEGDPVAAFELDSRLHDHLEQQRRDLMKDRLLETLQLPLFRLRAEGNISVGVDEWYALLTDEVADKIDCGRRLRIRTGHPTLIPA